MRHIWVTIKSITQIGMGSPTFGDGGPILIITIVEGKMTKAKNETPEQRERRLAVCRAGRRRRWAARTPEQKERDRVAAARRHGRGAVDEAIENFLVNFLSQMGCYCCEEDDYRVLLFHHVEIASTRCSPRAGKGWASVLSELRKCEAMCLNCHRIIHY